MSSLVFLLLISSLVDGVFGESVSVMEGDSVILHTDLTDVQSVNKITWKFGETGIAQLDRDTNQISIYNDALGGRFRDRLQLDNQTGSLTITNIRTEHTGVYHLKIISTSGSPSKTFNVDVIDGKSGGMKTVSVPMGESVILNTDKQTYDLIKWTFEADSLIAEIYRAAQKFSTYDGTDGRFRGRLTLDHQTGSLNIRNIRTEHTGLYQAEIKSSSHTILKIFSVTVSDVKTESVMKGESVTLHTDLTDVQRDDHILWIFETEYSIIAEINRETNTSTTHDGPDERFRDRLQLNDQTGSLTITDIRSTDSGLYKLEMKSSSHTIHKRFTVTLTASGLSPAAVAGIVGGVGLLLVAAVVFGVKYLLRDEVKTVMEGESAVLQIKTLRYCCCGIRIDLLFRGTHIAKMRINQPIYDDDQRFKGRLEMDKTGSLTIKNTRTTDTGQYEAKITICRCFSFCKMFYVHVCGEVKKDVMKGDSVTLVYKDPEIQTADEILWTAVPEDTIIAQYRRNTKEPLYTSDERFRDRLELNRRTGSLTITESRIIDSGLYTLKIRSGGVVTSLKRFSVFVGGEKKEMPVIMGDPVPLNPDDHNLHDGDKILWFYWSFDEKPCIAKVTRGDNKSRMYDDDDGRFRGRLNLDHQTGSLTITNTRITHSGEYRLLIISKNCSCKTFRVTVSGDVNRVLVKKGDSVTLNNETELQRDGVIEWNYEYSLIAKMSQNNQAEYPEGEERFRGRLQLDPQTGSLIIKEITEEHDGLYELKIKSSRETKTIHKNFFVTFYAETDDMSVNVGENVILHTGLTEVQKEDQMKWMFGSIPVANINGSRPSSDWVDGGFRDKLQVDPQTGSLIIKNIKIMQSGDYRLQPISSNRRESERKFRVIVCRKVPVKKGEYFTLETDLTDIKDCELMWSFRGERVAEISKGFQPSIRVVEKFKERIQVNHETGSLTISNSRFTDSGEYGLKILSSMKRNSEKIFTVTVWENEPPVSAQPALQAPPPASDSRNESTVIPMPGMTEETPDRKNESDPLLSKNVPDEENHEESSF